MLHKKLRLALFKKKKWWKAMIKNNFTLFMVQSCTWNIFILTAGTSERAWRYCGCSRERNCCTTWETETERGGDNPSKG